MFEDVRFGVRMAAKAPGSTVVAILALAVGIGGTSVVFTNVNACLLRPLPYPNLERVVTVWESPPRQSSERAPASPANFLDWRGQTTVFEHLAAYRPSDANLTGSGDPERLQGFAASPELVSVLAMPPMLGRAFRPEEAEPGRDAVVALSYGLWKRRFAGDPKILGRTLTLNGRAHEIVAVMPLEFDFPLATDVWTPLALTSEERAQRADRSLHVLGRLKAGVSLEQARAEMTTVAGRIAAEHPRTNEGRSALVIRLRQLTNEVTSDFVLILFATAGFVMLLACANVANLQLARATGRRRETALRTVLGATRWRVARQFVVENLLISMAGGVLGLLIAFWIVEPLRASIPETVFRYVAGLKNIHVDGTVVAFNFGAAAFTGVLCGLAPFFQSRGALYDALKEGGRSGAGFERRPLRRALVIAEVSLALILLVGAGVMVQAFRKIMTVRAGFDPRNILTMDVSLSETRYRDQTRIIDFEDAALGRLASLSGIRAAGSSSGMGLADTFAVDGRPAPLPGEPLPRVAAVSADYFRAMGFRVLKGRPVSDRDDRDAERVVVLGESVARNYFPTEDPLGRRVRIGGGDSPPLEIVGVVGDLKDWFTGRPIPYVYVASRQQPARTIRLVLRTAGDPADAAAAARAAILAVDPEQPVYDVKTMEQALSDQTSGVRSSAAMMAVFAIIALALAACGIYAVVSYSVAERTQELGVRMALGAQRGDVLRLVVAHTSRLALAGIGVGLPVSLALTRLASSKVQGVIPLDPAVFAGLTVTLAGVAVLAGYLPALRATRIDPLSALRHD